MIGILTSILISLVVSGISYLISSALAPKPKAPPGTEVAIGGDVPLSFLVGTVGTAGKIEYENSWGASGDTPNAYLTAVYSFGDLPGVACTGIYENGQALTKSATGHVTQGYPIVERANGAVNRCWWEFFDGTQTVVDSFLSSKFAADVNYPYASDMIGRGIPYMRMTAEIDTKVWNGSPSYLFQCQGIPLYDPTQDTTVGGSGSQRLATPSSWAFSDNPAVIVYNILLGIYYGSTWVWGGRFLRDSSGAIIAGAVARRLPYATWAAAINACNTSITLNAGGSEKQFRAGREIYTSEQPIDVINELLSASNARMTEQAGIYGIAVGDPGSAAATFTDADIVIGETQSLEPFPALDDVINGATGTYREPQQAWANKDISPYYNSTYETADDGRRQLVDLQLNVVFSGTQAQRILQAQVKDARRFKKHVLTLTPKWGTYRPLDVLAWTSTRNSYTAKAFLIAGMTILPNGNSVVALQEIDPSDHTWTPGTDEKAISYAPLVPVTPAAIPMTAWAVSPYTFPDSSATPRRPGIQVQYTGKLPDVQFVQIQVRENFGSNNTVFDSQFTYDPTLADPVSQPITWAGIIPNSAYQVRGLFLSPISSGRTNSWSTWISVTTPDVPDVSPSVNQQLADMAAMIRDAMLQAQELALRVAEQDLGNYSDKQTILTTLQSVTDGATADYQQRILVATGPNSAIAAQITTLQATVNDPTTGVAATSTALLGLTATVASQGGQITASSTLIAALQTQLGNSGANAQFLIHAGVSPSAGWDASIGLQTSVTAGGTSYDAGIYIESKSASGGSARVLLKGQQIAFVDSFGAVGLLFDTNGTFIAAANITDLTVTNLRLRGVGGYVGIDADSYLKLLSTTRQIVADQAVTTDYGIAAVSGTSLTVVDSPVGSGGSGTGFLFETADMSITQKSGSSIFVGACVSSTTYVSGTTGMNYLLVLRVRGVGGTTFAEQTIVQSVTAPLIAKPIVAGGLLPSLPTGTYRVACYIRTITASSVVINWGPGWLDCGATFK